MDGVARLAPFPSSGSLSLVKPSRLREDYLLEDRGAPVAALSYGFRITATVETATGTLRVLAPVGPRPQVTCLTDTTAGVELAQLHVPDLRRAGSVLAAGRTYSLTFSGVYRHTWRLAGKDGEQVIGRQRPPLIISQDLGTVELTGTDGALTVLALAMAHTMVLRRRFPGRRIP